MEVQVFNRTIEHFPEVCEIEFTKERNQVFIYSLGCLHGHQILSFSRRTEYGCYRDYECGAIIKLLHESNFHIHSFF